MPKSDERKRKKRKHKHVADSDVAVSGARDNESSELKPPKKKLRKEKKSTKAKSKKVKSSESSKSKSNATMTAPSETAKALCHCRGIVKLVFASKKYGFIQVTENCSAADSSLIGSDLFFHFEQLSCEPRFPRAVLIGSEVEFDLEVTDKRNKDGSLKKRAIKVTAIGGGYVRRQLQCEVCGSLTLESAKSIAEKRQSLLRQLLTDTTKKRKTEVASDSEESSSSESDSSIETTEGSAVKMRKMMKVKKVKLGESSKVPTSGRHFGIVHKALGSDAFGVVRRNPLSTAPPVFDSQNKVLQKDFEFSYAELFFDATVVNGPNSGLVQPFSTVEFDTATDSVGRNVAVNVTGIAGEFCEAVSKCPVCGNGLRTVAKETLKAGWKVSAKDIFAED